MRTLRSFVVLPSFSTSVLCKCVGFSSSVLPVLNILRSLSLPILVGFSSSVLPVLNIRRGCHLGIKGLGFKYLTLKIFYLTR